MDRNLSKTSAAAPAEPGCGWKKRESASTTPRTDQAIATNASTIAVAVHSVSLCFRMESKTNSSRKRWSRWIFQKLLSRAMGIEETKAPVDTWRYLSNYYKIKLIYQKARSEFRSGLFFYEQIMGIQPCLYLIISNNPSASKSIASLQG